MSLLIVVLPPPARGGPTDTGLPCGFVVSADGQTVTHQGQTSLALLPRPAQAEVVVLVPAPALAWHPVQLPPGSLGRGAAGARQRAILDGLLEDHLLDDAAQVHLALTPALGGTGPGVMACQRSWLQAWLQALQAQGLEVSRVVPEALPQPELVASLVQTLDGQAWWVTSQSHGVRCLPWTALAALSAPDRLALCPELAEGRPAPQVEPACATQAEAVLQRPVQLISPAQRWLDAALAAKDGGWNLAQFDLAHTGRRHWARDLRQVWTQVWQAPHWRPARWGMAALVVVQLVGLNAWAWHERQRLAEQRDASRQLLVQTFPQVKVVVDPALQMARELARLEQSSGSLTPDDLESQLTVLASLAPPGRSLHSLDYQAGVLKVQGLALQDTEFAPLAERLRARGYSAEREGATLVMRPLPAGARP